MSGSHNTPSSSGSGALLTDLYQLTMAQGYWKSGLAEREAVFHLFFRRLPFSGGYAIAAGLEPGRFADPGRRPLLLSVPRGSVPRCVGSLPVLVHHVRDECLRRGRLSRLADPVALRAASPL